MAWPMVAMEVVSLLASLYQAYQKKREMDKNMGAAGAMPQTPNYVSMAQPQMAPAAQRQTVGTQDEWLKTLLEQLMQRQTRQPPVPPSESTESNALYDILSRYQ